MRGTSEEMYRSRYCLAVRDGLLVSVSGKVLGNDCSHDRKQCPEYDLVSLDDKEVTRERCDQRYNDVADMSPE